MRALILTCLVFLAVSLPASFAQANAAEQLRDPMKPPAMALQKKRAAEAKKNPKPVVRKVEVAPPKPLVLQSIIFSAARQIAIINDLPLVSGESIAGAKVLSIKEDRVTLVRRGKKLELMLDSDSQAINKTRPKSKL